MMKCKDLKVRSKKYQKYFYCSKFKKEISFSDCKLCDCKSYPEIKISKPKKNPKIAKLERNRYSILTNNLGMCIECGRIRNELHEVYFGVKHRTKSMEWGCVIPLCSDCHDLIHEDIRLDTKYKILCEEKFIQLYSYDKFVEIFNRNYI